MLFYNIVMCGIIAILGYNCVFSYILQGLTMLQNRGYDSAGICTLHENNNKNSSDKKLILNKYASNDQVSALEKLQTHEQEQKDSTIGIGHTRWATHGPKTDLNSHPHYDHKEQLAVVHNGIIENFYELREELQKKGIVFISQTDTEVIANLISVYYDETGHMEEAMRMAVERFEGTWGLVVMCKDRPNNLYCARHGSPLLIGDGGNFFVVTSEQSGFCGKLSSYICLNDGDIVVLRKQDNKVLFEKKTNYDRRDVTIKGIEMSPDPFPHWTIKEINEQRESSLRAMGMGGRIKNDSEVNLGGLMDFKNDLLDITNVLFLGCGTSYHAGLYSSFAFKDLCDFNVVQTIDGSEFNEKDIPKIGKTLCIFISQSGETKDLHRCISICRSKDVMMMGVVNVVDSMISREVHCGVYLNAGREVGVASTKAFTSQVIILSMIAIWFAQYKSINKMKRCEYIKSLRQLPYDIKNTIKTADKTCQEIAEFLVDKHSCFLLGKSSNESIAKEGSLKMKEIGYIHAEGYGGSCLKHGPFALLDKQTPVFLIIVNDEFMTKMDGTAEEVISRFSPVIGITNTKIKEDKYNYIVKTTENRIFNGVLNNTVFQLISYYLSVKKGINPDLPRNLAKCVTTD